MWSVAMFRGCHRPVVRADKLPLPGSTAEGAETTTSDHRCVWDRWLRLPSNLLVAICSNSLLLLPRALASVDQTVFSTIQQLALTISRR